MNYTQLLEEVKFEVTLFFQNHQTAGFIYHTISHTQNVVSNASRIARHYKLNDRDFFIAVTAAWYHDTGYYMHGAEEHEKRGAEAAAIFLKSKGLDEETIGSVTGCVMATQIPQLPQNLLEQIVCDADLFHFGTEAFAEQNKLMHKEAEWRLGKKIPKNEWRLGTIRLLESHHYHTDYCVGLLQDGKRQNLKKLRSKLKESEPVILPEASSVEPPVNAAAEKLTLKKQKTDRPERGIETMFRISSNNHQRLSDMADNKAHIMITTTSIIISVLLSVLLRKLEDNPHLLVPTLILLIVCLITMVFSILATRPTIPGGSFTQQDIDDKKVNLLFFGNFYRMKYEEYHDGMQQLMNDRDFLYGSLTRDVYSQGVVLGRKYKLLRSAYNVFMFGIIVSVLAFMIAVVAFGQ